MTVIDDRTPHRNLSMPNRANKLKDDISRLRAALSAIDIDFADLIMAVAAKAAAVHKHPVSDVNDLVGLLSQKAALNHNHALGSLTDVKLAGAANGQFLAKQGNDWIPAFVAISGVSGLTEVLAGKASAADVTAAINGLIGAAPGALDTIAELATALGNDPNFADTLTTSLGLRVSKTITVANNASLSTVIESGFYRLNSHPDLPHASCASGQMIVSRGGETISQMVSSHSSPGMIFIRSGNPSNIGGAGAMGAWKQFHTGARTVSAVAPSGGADGDIWYQV